MYYTNTDVVYYIKATLDDYIILYPTEATLWVPFNLQIINCQVTDYNFPAVSVPTLYNIYTPIYWIPMTTFTEVVATDPLSRTSCGYTITYTVQWEDFYETSLAVADTNFVTWNASDFRYEIRSDDVTHITGDRQIYKLQLTGAVSITDMNPVF